MKNYDLKSIMSKAWGIYKNADQGDGLRPVFSMCLAMAWEDAKNQPASIIQEWANMEAQAQVNMITANVKKAAKNEIGFSTGDGYNSYNENVAWFFRHHQLDALVNEAWVKLAGRLDPVYLEELNSKREDKGKIAISLVALVYRSAKDAIRTVYHDDIKHGCASVRTIKDKDGQELEYIDTVAQTREASVEYATITALTMEDFYKTRDSVDRIIIEGKRDGYTNKEIAAAVGISAVAIHKRIKKLREALTDAGLFQVKSIA